MILPEDTRMKLLVAALFALASWAAIAQAPACPVKPVNIVVP